jgi:hypothetical protein
MEDRGKPTDVLFKNAAHNNGSSLADGKGGLPDKLFQDETR